MNFAEINRSKVEANSIGEANISQILTTCENALLEAKRILLNEELEKPGNFSILKINDNEINHNPLEVNDLMKIQNSVSSKPSIKEIVNDQTKPEIFNMCQSDDGETGMFNTKDTLLAKKYFKCWEKQIHSRKQKYDDTERKLQKNMLDVFIRNLKKFNKRKETDTATEKHYTSENCQKPTSLFKNRYHAQKTVINLQKEKIEEQNKIIHELKLGIIREDLLKSIDSTKNDIREIFSSCSKRVKCKVPLLEHTEEREKMMIKTQKAPKVVQQMEWRALERAHKREVILERKRILEENRQRILEVAIEKKRILEEEEKKRNLDLIKERRMKEVELERTRQIKKQLFLRKLSRAIDFHNRLLIRLSFQKLINNYQTSKKNKLLALTHNSEKVKQWVFHRWCIYIEDKYKSKNEIAYTLHRFKILKHYFGMWYNVYIEGKRSMQVAEDLYDFRLTSNTFILWNQNVCSQIVTTENKVEVAHSHYKRWLLFHYFYLWKSLPAVLQLEKAKEQRKIKWRQKVWEVLPDYKPPENLN